MLYRIPKTDIRKAVAYSGNMELNSRSLRQELKERQCRGKKEPRVGDKQVQNPGGRKWSCPEGQQQA